MIVKELSSLENFSRNEQSFHFYYHIILQQKNEINEIYLKIYGFIELISRLISESGSTSTQTDFRDPAAIHQPISRSNSTFSIESV